MVGPRRAVMAISLNQKLLELPPPVTFGNRNGQGTLLS